jgi:hypothetical protein
MLAHLSDDVESLHHRALQNRFFIDIWCNLVRWYLQFVTFILIKCLSIVWFRSLNLHQVRTTHTNIRYHLHPLNPTCFEQSSSLSVPCYLQKKSEPPTTKIVFRTCSVNKCGTCFVFDAKLRNTTVSFVMSDRPSVRVLWARNNAAPTVCVFTKFYIWGFFENLSRKFRFH